jgi:hypothetical protein
VSDLPQSAPDLERIYREPFAWAPEYRRRVGRVLTACSQHGCFPPRLSWTWDVSTCEFINHIQA